MKNTIIALAICSLLISFSSCNKKDISVIGKWNIDSKTTYIDGNETSTRINQGWIEFKDDGVGEYEDGESFTWNHSDRKLTIMTREGARTFKVATLKKKEMVLEASFTVLERETIEKWKLSKL